MKASSLELLTKAQLPAAQAQAILQAMDEEFDSRDSALATKADLGEAKAELRQEIAATRAELREAIMAAKTETIRWNFAFWIAQLGAIAGLLKLMK